MKNTANDFCSQNETLADGHCTYAKKYESLVVFSFHCFFMSSLCTVILKQGVVFAYLHM